MVQDAEKELPDDGKGEEEGIEMTAGYPVRVKFEIYGEEMIEKKVNSSSNSGRVYLPPHWVGHQVKIIRVD